MSYRWATWLEDALRKEGCDVVLSPGWKTRGRWRSDGNLHLPPNWDFDPDGSVVWHHTASTTSDGNPWPTGALLIRGRSDLPGPLCQCSPDHVGKMHLIAAGRANHAGTMSGAGPTNRGEDGNVRSIGFEIDTNGTQPIPLAQYRASIRGAAAVTRRYKRPSSWAMGHKETSVTGKWDPGVGGKTVNLDAWRADLAECLSYPPGVWHSKVGTSSWGEVQLSQLKTGGAGATVKKLQYRIKRANATKVPASIRKAVVVNGKWDAATVSAVDAWQQLVFAPSTSGADDGVQSGQALGPRQAAMLFGTRYHLVK